MSNRTTSAPPNATGSVTRNTSLTGLRCIRCERVYKLDDPQIDRGLGCRDCLHAGFPAGLYCVYESKDKLISEKSRSGMFRYSNKLPFLQFPSLGEGQTPLLSLPNRAKNLGVDYLAVKNEGQNPTGSHKDRMSPLAVARALDADFSKVIASSSGNAGASLASYAARARTRCCIIGEPSISPAWAHAIKLSGAELRLVESDQRWPLMQKLVEDEGWFPVTNFWATPIGSNPFGIEGYKTIAHEIAEQSSVAPPTVVIIPTCRGDMLFGIWRGFVEAQEAGLIRSVPRLVAAEPGPRLELALTGVDYRSKFEIEPNIMTSIDGATATYQSLKALTSSEGHAVSVGSDAVYDAQRAFAEDGLHVEASSAASLAGLWQLKRQGYLKSKDRIVLIATSHGYKEPPDTTPQAVARLSS
ncbi:MAG: pyridoxal-phosphate dependent enzyme [Cyanobacteria bacterium]|nr:pyridoxal-phosphate dependent enzyme [Cyanobacteriota bacterium]